MMIEHCQRSSRHYTPQTTEFLPAKPISYATPGLPGEGAPRHPVVKEDPDDRRGVRRVSDNRRRAAQGWLEAAGVTLTRIGDDDGAHKITTIDSKNFVIFFGGKKPQQSMVAVS